MNIAGNPQSNDDAKPAAEMPCLFNFIVYIHNEQRLEYFQEIVTRVLEKFPCRVIYIDANCESKESYLKSKQTRETLTSKSNQSSYDQILIEASKDQLDKVLYLLYPALVPDLPLYLLWGREPTSETIILPKIIPYAACLIFDSESADDLNAFCTRMIDFLAKPHCPLIDMNWARCSGWRHLLAQVFDCKEKIDQLLHSKVLQITYNDRQTQSFQHNKTQALYLQAWLAAMLGWSFESCELSENKIRLIYRFNSHPIIVDLLPTTIPLFSPGAIVAIETLSEDNHFFVMTRQQSSPELALVHISSLESCEMPFTSQLPTMQRSFSFIQEILYNPSYEHYSKMLAALAKELDIKPLLQETS